MSQKKLTPQPGQPGLKPYLQTTPKCQKVETIEDRSKTKKRTSPSLKKTNFKKACKITIEDPNANTVIAETAEDTTHKDVPEDDRKKKIYSQFTPEIIECLREVIKKVQIPLEDKLNTLLDVQNKQLEQDSHIKDLRKEQKELR